MEEQINVKVEGINAVFASARDLNRARIAHPEMFVFTHGILMMVDPNTGNRLRVILPVTDDERSSVRAY